jgi:hypothetical protein
MTWPNQFAVVEFSPRTVVGGIEPKAPSAEFGTKLLLFAGEALELRPGILAAGEADQKSLEQGGDGCGLLRCLGARRPVKIVVDADSDVFHNVNRISQFHRLASWKERDCEFMEI